MADKKQGGDRRFRQLPSGEKEYDDGVDRGDGRTAMGTFPQGRSGNPNGRPRGALNATTIVRQELSRRVILKSADGDEPMSKFAAAVMKLLNVGLLQGNVRALERIIALGLSVEDKEQAAKPPLPVNDADRAALTLIAKRLVEARTGMESAPAGEKSDV